ncbi:MAG: cation:proton antiporter [Chitinophagales bacterium]
MESNNIILIILCILVVISYLFDIFSRRTRIPSVLLLLLTGIGLRMLTDYYQIETINFLHIIPALGTVGLILIVFEGGLELEYKKEKNRTILNALLLSVLIMVATSVGIAFIFQYFTEETFHVCLVNAIPYSVISSAIAIPSAKGLSESKKEFITFESSFSDIFGIIFFHYAIAYEALSFVAIGHFTLEIILVSLVSFAFCMILLFLMKSIGHHVKFILIITVMILLYAVGKQYNLSSLILVMFFGLIIKNITKIQIPFIQNQFNNEKFHRDFDFLHRITAEGVFLIKTFFFLIFGFIIDIYALLDVETLIIAGCMLFAIYFVRLIFLRLFNKSFMPELLYSPRGLISILLFLSLPHELKISSVEESLLFMMVLGTSLVMLFTVFSRNKQ